LPWSVYNDVSVARVTDNDGMLKEEHDECQQYTG
jgi:hypothetical protein